MSNKFIVVDTWNGEGYSSENGTDIKIMNNSIDAERYAELMATSNLPYPSDARFESEKVEIHQRKDFTVFTFEIDEDGGSYQVHKLIDDAFAVCIKTNVNDVEILTESEYNNLVESLKEDLKALNEAEEDYFEYDDNGDLLVLAFEDYDYQFRLIKNI